jgi:hypothetical protein
MNIQWLECCVVVWTGAPDAWFTQQDDVKFTDKNNIVFLEVTSC